MSSILFAACASEGFQPINLPAESYAPVVGRYSVAAIYALQAIIVFVLCQHNRRVSSVGSVFYLYNL